MLFIFANMGCPSTSFGVYQPYIVALDGIGHSGGSIILACRTLASVAAMFVVTIYYRRLDCRYGVTLALCLSALGFFVYACSSSLFSFCIGALLTGFGYGLGGMVGMTLLVGRWYGTHKGIALGVGASGSALASMLVPPCVLSIIAHFSIHHAFFIEGVCIAIIAIICFCALRNSPADAEHKFHGLDADEKKAIPEKSNLVSKSNTMQNALLLNTSNRRFLLFAMFCIGMGSVGMSYLSVLVSEGGFSETFAASMISLAGLSLLLFKFISGELFDHIDTAKASALMFVILFCGLVLCCFVQLHLVYIAVLGAILYGGGAAIGTTGTSLWSLELSNQANRAKTIKDFQIWYALGSFVANMCPGFLKELTGSYVPAYALNALATAMAALIILSIYKRLRADQNQT